MRQVFDFLSQFDHCPMKTGPHLTVAKRVGQISLGRNPLVFLCVTLVVTDHDVY